MPSDTVLALFANCSFVAFRATAQPSSRDTSPTAMRRWKFGFIIVEVSTDGTNVLILGAETVMNEKE